MTSEMKRKGNRDETAARCCGNCARFSRDPSSPGYGWCGEWPFRRVESSVCHPYVGSPKQDGARTEEGGAK